MVTWFRLPVPDVEQERVNVYDDDFYFKTFAALATQQKHNYNCFIRLLLIFLVRRKEFQILYLLLYFTHLKSLGDDGNFFSVFENS